MGVMVTVGVTVGVCVTVGVTVSVGVSVGVGLGVGVAVGVGVGAPKRSTGSIAPNPNNAVLDPLRIGRTESPLSMELRLSG